MFRSSAAASEKRGWTSRRPCGRSPKRNSPMPCATLRLDVTLACIDVLAARALRPWWPTRCGPSRSSPASTARGWSRVRLPRSSRPVRCRHAAVPQRPVVRADLDLAAATARLRALLGRSAPESARSCRRSRDRGERRNGGGRRRRLEEVALETRPDLRALAARSGAVGRRPATAGGARADRLQRGRGYRRQQGFAGRSNSLGFFFSMPLPVLNRNQGEIARAGAEGDQAVRSCRPAARRLSPTCASRYHDYVTTHDLVAGIERDLIKPATSARDISAYTYRAGGGIASRSCSTLSVPSTTPCRAISTRRRASDARRRG